MLMDVDVVLGAPVTCNSLFDDRGRLYQAGMPLKHQQQFASIIADTVGPWEWTYMIFFPFTVPMSVFPRMRSHVTKFMGFNEDQFDDAMASWAAKQDNVEYTFCGYCMLGAYMDMYESERVNALHCPLQGEHQGTDCANWVSVGTHWGWRPCGYAESCTHGASDSVRRENVGELSQRTSKKYGIKAWEYIEKISVDGKCFMHYMNTGEMLQGCTEEQSLHVNEDLLPYPGDPPSKKLLRKCSNLTSGVKDSARVSKQVTWALRIGCSSGDLVGKRSVVFCDIFSSC